ncbi:PKD domain-containing protein [Methanosarcina sp.]|uniref:PKD domain-containing protein n=1 Tax=Methanosarcina sp. TaxID=2213 RepID=UPI002988C142|nr:PKD domain-containing protein [Methanosarcina sp.]MDW5549607.1 PKD domain-containing protein [Methanosarcina sp.]MDW5553639.1 PKD domain-containing protein [Methanosarcina sp.]MDW5558555.1 PKD domain-containing protein [Methanosarcina sp.]
MKTNKKLNSVALTSIALILFLIFVSSAASAATEQSTSSLGKYAYITNELESTLSIIDTTTNTVTATVPAGNEPAAVAVNPDGTKVYVANFYLWNDETILSKSTDTKLAFLERTTEHVATDEGAISVIDTATNTLKATVPVGSLPAGVAVSPDGTKVYVANRGSNTVSVIDAATNTVTATMDVGSGPNGIAVNPDGTKVYVTNMYSDTVSVIDAATNTVTTTVNVGSYPWGVAVSPSGTKVYVSSTGSDTVSVIDTATNKVTATVPVGSFPIGIAVKPDGTKVYVANEESNTISVIDTATNKVTATVTVGNYPLGVAVKPDGTKVYVANSNSNTVSVINAATNTVTVTIPVGNGPVAFGQFIGPLSLAPFASFSAKSTEGKAPLTVAFTDKSTRSPTKWKWEFGDGTTSTKQNPTHKYSKVGSYTVKLTVTNAKGNNTATKIDYIKVVTKPVANFSAKPTSGKAPLTVDFTDQSTGIATRWKWSFGDGTISREKNPKHRYLQEGNYKVTLTVSNLAGSSTVMKTNFIKVTTNTRPGIYSESK